MITEMHVTNNSLTDNIIKCAFVFYQGMMLMKF